MEERIRLNELEQTLDDLEYPIAREDVIEQCSGVRIELADGSETVSELIAGSNDDAFGSVDSLANEIRSLLPQNAVGEPYQSEGEG